MEVVGDRSWIWVGLQMKSICQCVIYYSDKVWRIDKELLICHHMTLCEINHGSYEKFRNKD